MEDPLGSFGERSRSGQLARRSIYLFIYGPLLRTTLTWSKLFLFLLRPSLPWLLGPTLALQTARPTRAVQGR